MFNFKVLGTHWETIFPSSSDGILHDNRVLYGDYWIKTGADWDTFDDAKLMIFAKTFTFNSNLIAECTIRSGIAGCTEASPPKLKEE